MNRRTESLDQILRSCWQTLERAAAEADHEWRVMVLATVGDDGAELRSVILREVDAPAGCLVFYTDARSPKVTQLQRHPRASLLVWSRALGWQLRLRCRFEIETAGLAASSRWASLKLTPAAQDYLSPLPPGTPLVQPLPERGSRGHFAMIHAHVEQIDWLEVHRDGHRRALFAAQGARWLSP